MTPLADPHLANTVQNLLLAGAAFLAGLVDAIGGGGGLISLPALLAVGLPPASAIATNKGQAIFGAVSSFVSFWRRGGIDRQRAPLGFLAGFAGSCFGAAALMTMRPEPYEHLLEGRVYDGLEELERRGDPATLAVAWLLADPRVTAVVVGPRRPDHLRPALDALGLPVERDVLSRLFE